MGGVAVLVTFPFLKTPLTFDLDHYLQPTQLALKGKASGNVLPSAAKS
jgi:hypothetical protein